MFNVTMPVWISVFTILMTGAGLWSAAVRQPHEAESGKRSKWSALALAAALVAGATLLPWIGTSGSEVLRLVIAAIATVWCAQASYARLTRRLGGTLRLYLTGLRAMTGLLLLAIVARAGWSSRVVEMERPLVAVVLDDSLSMGLSDRKAGAEQNNASRAERVTGALREAESARSEFLRHCDVRILRFAAPEQSTDNWTIRPAAPVTNLVQLVEHAAGLRNPTGRTPAAILIISDGAQNTGPERDLVRVAASLGQRGVPILAAGVGPSGDSSPLIRLDPLAVPARIGLRERIAARVTGEAVGCSAESLSVEFLWDELPATKVPLDLRESPAAFRAEAELAPPGPGVHRLTAQIRLPGALGGEVVRASALVDVAAERIRVLLVERAPRNEAAFVVRALAGDPNLLVTRWFLNESGRIRSSDAGAPDWRDFDVVIIGDVRDQLPGSALDTLATAVTDHGVGLLVAGGRAFLNRSRAGNTKLVDVLPAEIATQSQPESAESRFDPTPEGLEHPVLKGVWSGPATSGRGNWLALPPLRGFARLGEPRPLATVLATDPQQRPLLLVQNSGRGRVIIAAWEATWPWSMASDEGAAMHRRLWRQLVQWLANRAPSAWVITDEPAYPASLLLNRQRHVRIRAGVSGQSISGSANAGGRASLQIARADGLTPSVELPLRATGEEWSAAWPMSDDRVPVLPGEYELVFTYGSTPSASGSDAGLAAEGPPRPPLIARTRFVVSETELELQSPTANLPLLRAAAEATRDCGGAYGDIRELGTFLKKLAELPEPPAVERVVQVDPVTEAPWPLLAGVVMSMAFEWIVRKRAGLI